MARHMEIGYLGAAESMPTNTMESGSNPDTSVKMKGKKMEENDNCPAGCGGVMKFHIENCSCHISAPCSACVYAPLVCNKCGEEYEEECEPVKAIPTTNNLWWIQKPRTEEERFADIPDNSFGYWKEPNKGWGMAVFGKYPEGMTANEIIQKCGVCEYGLPRFKYFKDGRFKFTYNYD